jgi:hypothetical protein
MGFCVLLERRGITRKNVLVLALALQGIRKKERKKERKKGLKTVVGVHLKPILLAVYLL